MPSDRFTIDVSLVAHLVRSQFPHWADLPIRPVATQGWDNQTFHLGDALAVRLPSAPGYALQAEKEQRWLPVLGPQLPLAVPQPIASGQPDERFPYTWGIYNWLEGETARPERIENLDEFARTLANFLTALQRIDATDGPLAGPHSAFRGAPLATYHDDTVQCVNDLQDVVNVPLFRSIWYDALAEPWQQPPVWFHGDVAVGNLLVQHRRLSAVLDFGCCGIGDPACDLVPAWTLFSGSSRTIFRQEMALDDATWARGRGWALWKALLVLREGLQTENATKTTDARRVLAEIETETIVNHHLVIPT